MKLSDVANELLKAMVKNYYATKKNNIQSRSIQVRASGYG